MKFEIHFTELKLNDIAVTYMHKKMGYTEHGAIKTYTRDMGNIKTLKEVVLRKEWLGKISKQHFIALIDPFLIPDYKIDIDVNVHIFADMETGMNIDCEIEDHFIKNIEEAKNEVAKWPKDPHDRTKFKKAMSEKEVVNGAL